jgi:hypothetical protein
MHRMAISAVREQAADAYSRLANRGHVVLCVVALLGSTGDTFASGPAASTDSAASPAGPLTVLTSDELYKPATLKDGQLIAVALPMADKQQRIEAIYSSDNGRKWSPPKPLFDLPRETGVFGYYDFLVDSDGELHFFFLLEPPRHGRAPEEQLDIYYVRSTANRTQWEPCRPIWTGRGGDLLSVIQLRSGRLLLPISYRTKRNWGNRGDGFDAYTYTGQFNSSAVYSDDGGKTWIKSQSELKTPTPDIETIEGAVEPVVLQLGDGRVWMLIRSQMGRFYESFSSDDGANWTRPIPTSIDSSDSPAALVRLPDNRMAMLWNNCLRFPYAYGGRHVLHAAISGDEGRTWRGYREVMRDPLRNQPPPPSGDFGPSYPYGTVTKDGKILFSMACETGTRCGQPENPAGFVPIQKRHLILVDPAWVTATANQEDFSDGLDEWSVFGVKGVEVQPQPARDERHVLAIKKLDAAWPSAAVWNFPSGATGKAEVKLLLHSGCKGAVISFTDHYSVPYDSEGAIHSVFSFEISGEGILPGGKRIELDRWHPLEIEFDTDRGSATVREEGRELAVLRAKRESIGLSYLRLQPLAPDTDGAGFLVESVEVSVKPASMRE